jgi:hypothetical protein
MAAVCVGGAAAADWKEDDHWAKHPLLAALTAAGCGTLPDVVEPALHPNHRQFFHSFLFAAGVSVALYKVYQWQPKSDGGELVRASSVEAPIWSIWPWTPSHGSRYRWSANSDAIDWR